jgi:hypothetical protein
VQEKIAGTIRVVDVHSEETNAVPKNPRLESFDDFMFLLKTSYKTQLVFSFHEMLFFACFSFPILLTLITFALPTETFLCQVSVRQ